jgi:hypothetical protein
MTQNVEIQYNSSVLELENLDMEFTLLMRQYEQAKMNYLNDLKTSPIKSDELLKDKKLMNKLNKKLLTLSQKIQSEIIINKSKTIQENEEKEKQHQNLVNSYSILLAERQKINEILEDYDSLDQEYDDSMLKLHSNNSKYLLWFALVITVVTYLFKLLFFPDLELNIFRMFFWLILFFLFVISTFHLNQSIGFLIWLSIILFFVFVNMKLIPSP